MGKYLAGRMQCSSLPGVGYGLQRMPMDSPGQIGCSLFFPFPLFFSLLNWGRGKRAIPVTTTVTLIVYVLLTSQLSGHRKSKEEDRKKKRKVSENGPNKNKNRNPYSE